MKKIKKLLVGVALGVLCCFSVTVTATEPSYASSSENPSIQDKIADYTKKVANKYTGWLKSKTEKAKLYENNQYYYQPIYYYMEKGKLVKNNWRTISGKKYYFESDGKMAYGVRNINGTYYVFNTTVRSYGALIQTNRYWIWAADSKQSGNPYTNITKSWVVDTNGKAVKYGWVKNISNGPFKGNVYLENYKPASGWTQISGKWYYFSSYFYVTGLHTISSKTYYFNQYGIMQTGLINYNNAKYFFNTNGAMIKNAWKKVGGYWYYFKNKGQAVSGTKMKINGKMYSFRTNGTCINP